ncbi:MAG: LPS-assembly protein LptD [Acidobacteria bacterium]|nr:LPS-assembly protein LptD [Acidobacteriota bacterium]
MWHLALVLFILLPAEFKLLGTPLPLAECQASGLQPPTEPRRPSALQQPAVEIQINADTQTYQSGVTIYEGYVDVRLGTMRLQTDKLIYNEKTHDVEAIGNVIYDQEGQRVTGSRAIFNMRTREGAIWNASGFTDRTPDGVTVYFQADRVERTGLDTFEIYNGQITSCDERVPKWSFTASHIGLRLNKRVSVRSPALRIKNVPLLWLPYATVPITKRIRNAGFLTPAVGNSNIRGRSFTIPYYQTLGPSADALSRIDVFTRRGIGIGTDFRSRTGPTSHLNTGFFAVFDRLFGQPEPKQGGTAFYLDAVQYVPAGFLLAADVNITSNLAFRQIFSDSFEQAISPEERTQIYINNNFREYSFNSLAQSRDVSLSPVNLFEPDQIRLLPDQLITIRQLPSFELARKPSRLSKALPLYLSFRTAAEGVSRAEATFQTPSVVQRLDVQPRLTIPLPSLGGLAITPSLTLRSTYYSDSKDPADRRNIRSQSVSRSYLELAVDIRPPGLERIFHHRDGSRWFKHVVEPSITYRRIAGIGSDFARIIRFDEIDAVAETNEFEFALVNRFFTTRQGSSGGAKQPHELLTIKLSQHYFFDPTFGGALVPGKRNQFYPIDLLSGFSFGGTPRRFSPVNLNVRLRLLSSLFADVRLDYDTREKTVRNASITGGIRRRVVSFSQSWYFTQRIHADQGTFPGDLYQSSLLIGNRERGLFGWFDLIYDFTNRLIRGRASQGRLVSSTFGFGYAFDCCSFQVQNTTFKIGLRNENRLSFSLTLNGIGSFGRHTDAGRRIFGPIGDTDQRR